MFFSSWFSRNAPPNFAATEQMVLADDEAPLLESSSKENGFDEKNRFCRDQLYEVIREAMTRSGVLSASYKFKVLSPDGPAGSYLVMIDLSSIATGSFFRPADTEAQIVQRALKGHAIAVSAVYWRLHAASSIGKIPDSPAGHTGDSTGLALPEKPAALQPATRTNSMAAGKSLGMKSGSRRPAPGPLYGFEETEATASKSYPALGATQYGELH